MDLAQKGGFYGEKMFAGLDEVFVFVMGQLPYLIYSNCGQLPLTRVRRVEILFSSEF